MRYQPLLCENFTLKLEIFVIKERNETKEKLLIYDEGVTASNSQNFPSCLDEAMEARKMSSDCINSSLLSSGLAQYSHQNKNSI